MFFKWADPILIMPASPKKMASPNHLQDFSKNTVFKLSPNPIEPYNKNFLPQNSGNPTTSKLMLFTRSLVKTVPGMTLGKPADDYKLTSDAEVRSHLSGFFAIQPLAAREEIGSLIVRRIRTLAWIMHHINTTSSSFKLERKNKLEISRFPTKHLMSPVIACEQALSFVVIFSCQTPRRLVTHGFAARATSIITTKMRACSQATPVILGRTTT